MNDAPWVKVLNHLMHGAHSSTRTARVTWLDFLQADLFSHFIFEMMVKFIKKPGFCSVRFHSPLSICSHWWAKAHAC
jgi:hypothetical protein